MGITDRRDVLCSSTPSERQFDDVVLVTSYLNPIWIGLFANVKRMGGGAFWPPPNLTISSQMMMKLGKNIIWVEIFTN